MFSCCQCAGGGNLYQCFVTVKNQKLFYKEND